MRTRLLLLVIAVLATAACGTATGGPDGSGTEGLDAFDGATWQLRSATVDGQDLTLVESHPVTLELTDGGLGGRSACNLYSGHISADGDTLRIGQLGGTEMGCLAEGVMELEAAYLSALPRVDSATRRGDQLVLTGEGVEFEFDLVPAEPDADLVDTVWVLDTLVDGETASSTVAGQEPTLTIDEDGQLEGNTGCNSFGATAEITADRLEVSPLAVTDMACAGVRDQETHVLAVLGGRPTVQVEGSRLTLSLDDGRGLVYGRR